MGLWPVRLEIVYSIIVLFYQLPVEDFRVRRSEMRRYGLWPIHHNCLIRIAAGYRACPADEMRRADFRRRLNGNNGEHVKETVRLRNHIASKRQRRRVRCDGQLILRLPVPSEAAHTYARPGAAASNG